MKFTLSEDAAIANNASEQGGDPCTKLEHAIFPPLGYISRPTSLNTEELYLILPLFTEKYIYSIVDRM